MKTHFNSSAVTNKWFLRVATAVFFGLTVFFAYPYSGFLSLFRKSLVPFSISIISVAFGQLRTIAYIGTLAFGIFLTLVFLVNLKNKESSKELAAANCAWLAFTLQATASLSFQWIPYNVWINQSVTLPILFGSAIVLLSASMILSTNSRWLLKAGYFISWISLLFNVVLLVFLLRFFVVFSLFFPTLAVIMTVNSGLAVYALHHVSLNRVKEKPIVNYNFKRFFPIKIIAAILLLVLILETVSFIAPPNYAQGSSISANTFYVGVTFGGNTTAQAKTLIDEVKNYTNLFVVDSLPISQNEAEMNEVCDYAVQNGLHVMVYFAWFGDYWQANFLDTAKLRWGDKFLGVYLYDEPGGVQLDMNGIKYGRIGPTPINQSQAESRYLRSFLTANRGKSDMQMLKIRNIQAFTSDYALYWYDYKAGYDVVFAQLGLNSLSNSTQLRQMTAEFARGAATVQHKDWGAIVTWAYDSPPYLESGLNLYDDMVFAYNYGAKYVLIFNYPYNSTNTYGILKQEHLDALRNFWSFTRSNAPASNSMVARTAFVLPKDDGYGFRGSNDVFWGFWRANDSSSQLTATLKSLTNQYGSNLDVVYNDGINPKALPYSEYIFWNGTITK